MKKQLSSHPIFIMLTLLVLYPLANAHAKATTPDSSVIIPHSILDDAIEKLSKTYSLDYSASKQSSNNTPASGSRITSCKKKSGDKKCREQNSFNCEGLAILDAAVKQVVDRGEMVGAYSTACVKKKCGGFDEHSFFAGVQNVQTQKPFTGNTIIRLGALTKFLGTVGFLKLIDRGVITGFEPLAQFIPAFANTKVMENVTPTATVNLFNAIIATNGSSLLTITENAHGRTTGDTIGIEGASAVQNISATVINNVFQITVLNGNQYTINVGVSATASSPAGEGGSMKIQSLPAGAKRTQSFGIIYYYQEVALNNPLLIYHVLTHELGYSSFIKALNLSFGYAADPVLRNTQAGIYDQLQIPYGVPDPSLPLSSQGIQQWANALAQVPLLFQPGTAWSYGPTLSILGALIEIIDGRDLETYLQDEVLRPLGMANTGFFIQNNAPDRAEKLDRIMTLYLANSTIPVTAFPTLGYLEDYFYGINQPKTLALIDGGCYSTPNDYLKFIKMLLNKGMAPSGERILSPAMLAWLSENHTLENSIFNILDFNPLSLTPAKWPKWGMGVAVTTGATASARFAGTSTRSIFWVSFFRSQYAVDFGNQVGVSVGTNVLGTERSIFRDRALILNYSALNCINPNNENSSGNNPWVSSDPR